MRVFHSNHIVPFYINKTETLSLNNHLHNVLMNSISKKIRIRRNNDTAPISEELPLIELSPLLGSLVRLKCVLIWETFLTAKLNAKRQGQGGYRYYWTWYDFLPFYVYFMKTDAHLLRNEGLICNFYRNVQKCAIFATISQFSYEFAI